jgi:CheY-like chemotaxis protein
MPHTLLLADDSVTIQRVIELTFADEDIRVIAVGDGQQAIDRVTADPPDIVLADTGMPEHDGYEVAAFIKNDPHLAHIPVVLLTGAFEPVDGDRATKAGCDAVLVKPFEPQEVIKRVRELLGKSAAPTAAVGIVGADGGHEAGPDPGRGLPAGFEPRPRPRPVMALEETPATPRPVPDEPTESPASLDNADPDPVSVYLDRVDAALDLLDNDRGAVEAPAEPAGEPMDEGPAPAVPSNRAEDPPDLDSLEGALSALEGALENLNLEPSALAEEDAAATSEPVGEPPSERLSTPVVEPIVEPIPESLEPVFAPVSDPVAASPSESVSAPIVEPVDEPVPELLEPVFAPVADPVSASSDSVFAPVADPVAETSFEPVSAPVAEPAPESPDPVFAPVAEPVEEAPPEPVSAAVEEPEPESLDPVFASVADPVEEAPSEPVVASIDEPASEPVQEPASVPGLADGDVASLPDAVSAASDSAIDNPLSDSAKLPPLEFLPPTVAEQPPEVDVTTDDPADQANEPVADQIAVPPPSLEPERAADQDPQLAADLVTDEGVRPESVVASAGPNLATVPTPVVDNRPVAEEADAPARPAPHAPVPSEWARPAQTFAPPRAAPPSLADAFASLLAAEQGATAQTRTPYPWSVSPRPADSDGDLVERVTDRVLARLSDTVTTELVTQIVTQVAERLVRAELDRLKS